jgi:hypothetical protein
MLAQSIFLHLKSTHAKLELPSSELNQNQTQVPNFTVEFHTGSSVTTTGKLHPTHQN